MIDSEKNQPQQEKQDDKVIVPASESGNRDASYALVGGGSSQRQGLRLVQGFGAVEGSDQHNTGYVNAGTRHSSKPVRIWLVPDPAHTSWNKSV